MLFSSITFLLFGLIFFGLWPLVKNLRARNLLITVASYIFYGFWSTPFLLLLILSTVVDYWAGILIAGSSTKTERNWLLTASLGYNLSVLFFFKYSNLFLDTARGVLSLCGYNVHFPGINVVLPIGISFYTFVTLSYTIDVWKGEIKPECDFIKYAAFVSYWPHLVAGPILRATQLLPQLSKRRKVNWQIFYQGLFLVSLGFFMKMVVADNMAKYVERLYNYPFAPTTVDAWIATYAYALQIFGDFSGYSGIAIGLALWMGFYIPQNFNAPYASASFTDFWKRWHISLSNWFRDYIFLPLAYSTHRKLERFELSSKGRNQATYAIGTVLTMLLCGLWHGAEWHFVAWGGVHGLCLAAERFFGLERMPRGSGTWWKLIVRRLAVFHLVCMNWVLFRTDFGRAWEIIKAMAGFVKPEAVSLYGSNVKAGIVISLAATIAIQHWFADKTLIGAAKAIGLTKLGYALLVSLMLLFVILARGTQSAFIYFQF